MHIYNKIQLKQIENQRNRFKSIYLNQYIYSFLLFWQLLFQKSKHDFSYYLDIYFQSSQNGKGIESLPQTLIF